MKVIGDDDEHFPPRNIELTNIFRFDHFKKFARKGKFFEMLSWGGLHFNRIRIGANAIGDSSCQR